MTPTTRKRLLIGAGGIVGLLIVALLAIPAFIDANSYKPEIVAEVKRATGRDLILDGPVSLTLLPMPTVTIAGVRFFNVSGAKNPNMVEVKSVTVKPWLPALLTGGIEIGEVILIEPKIVLEINAEGKPNWEFAPSVAQAQPAAPKPSSAKPLSLGRLAIENGTLIFSDSKAGLSVVAEKANFSAAVDSMDGPYSLTGDATVNGAALKIHLKVGAKSASGHNADVSLQAGGGRLAYNGILSELGPNARLIGKASASADNLIAFAEALSKMIGQPLPVSLPLLAGKFSFEGDVDLSQTAIASKDFKLTLGEDSGTGSLALTLKPALAVDTRFVAKRLDLDRWLASIALPQQLATQLPIQEPLLPAEATVRPAPQSTRPPASTPSLLASITAKLAFEVGEVIYNKKPIRDVAVDLEARGGAVAVPKFNLVLPGDLTVQTRSTMSGDPGRPSVSGEFSLVGTKLRETLAWLDVDVSSVPSTKLTRLSMKGALTSNGGNAEVKGAAVDLDDLKGKGDIVVTFTVPLSVVTHLEFDTIDLDSYIAPAAQKSPTASGTSPGASAVPILALLGPAVGLRVKIAKMLYRGDTVADVEVDVARQGGTLRLNDLKVANLAGARLALRGVVANYWESEPRADFAFHFEAPDLDRLLKLAGMTHAGLGAVAASGGVAGTFEQLALRDVALSAMGMRARATGTLALPGAAQGPPISASYRGSVTVNGQTIQGSVDATLTDKPSIVADLKAGVLDLDQVGGAAAGSQSVSKPIDTSPLRSVDGTLKLSAASLISSPLRIADADMAATLKDGVLTLSHVKGSLYGGMLSLSGTVNGSAPALSFDFRGDANGIHIGELLRTASGTNVFGSILNVAIDGSLNANGIALRGGGATAAEIRSSMAGGARLSGDIRASADRFLQFLASAATGVVGGAIDLTLGNLASLAGEKGGVGIGNLLNAISLVLHRFVNHDNAVSGQLDIAGGILTATGLVVQGSGATAHVATHTNLGNATTQTTINFVIAEDTSGPYLITTASGPLSGLSFNATRGSAKDPPGIESLVPNIGHLFPKGGPSSLIPSISVPHIPLPSIPNPFGR